MQTRALTGNIATSNNALRIGGNTLWGEYFNGLIDEVRVYSRGLSQTEIQSDMNTPVGGGSGGLAAMAPATPAGPLPFSPLTSGAMAPRHRGRGTLAEFARGGRRREHAGGYADRSGRPAGNAIGLDREWKDLDRPRCGRIRLVPGRDPGG